MGLKLTKRVVAELAPAGGTSFFWDEELPGFGVRVSPGGTKAFVVQYREARKTVRKTLGSTEVLALDRARNAARDIMAAIRLGETLPAKKNDGPLFSEVLDQFIDFAKAKKAPRTASDYEDRINRVIRPVFGAKRILAIKRADIEKWHEGAKATPRSANYHLAILVAVFSYAVRLQIIDANQHPARAIQKYRENKRTRYLTLDEVKAFGEALAALESKRAVSPWAAAALRLLILTGARSGEILTLRWSFVDLDAAELRLPTSKTGAKTIKLSAAAVDILKAIPRVTGVDFVICGRIHGEAMTSLQRPFGVVCKAAGITDVRIHDLRHSAASIAASAGIGLPVVGALLGQSQAYTTQRYSHIHDAAERQAAETISAAVAPLLGRKVVLLRRPGK